MASEIVDNDDVARSERRHEKLFDVGLKALAVDRPIDDAGSIDPVAAQSGQEGQCSPMSLWHFGQKLAPAGRPATQAGHIGLGPGFVDEDQPFWIKPALIRFPTQPPSCDVGAILLGGEQSFF